jgi:1-acyl-sn-glycerol-3-phosphate acyltransferase
MTSRTMPVADGAARPDAPQPPPDVNHASDAPAPGGRRTPLWMVLQAVARILTTVLFDLKVYGARHVPPHGGVLVVSNHQSYLDPVLVAVQLRRPMSFLGKSELFRNRFFAWLIRSLNAFPVRQGAGDVGAVKETINRLQAGHLLNIYPEGSRTEDGELLPILAGVALVIRRAGVPVVPCVIGGSYDAWPKGTKVPRPHPIRVLYGPPMDLSGAKPAEIVRTIDQTFRRMLDELRAKAPDLDTPQARRRQSRRA